MFDRCVNFSRVGAQLSSETHRVHDSQNVHQYLFKQDHLLVPPRVSIWSSRLLEAATSSSGRGTGRVRAATRNNFQQSEGGQLKTPLYRGKAELQPIPVTPLNQVGS